VDEYKPLLSGTSPADAFAALRTYLRHALLSNALSSDTWGNIYQLPHVRLVRVSCSPCPLAAPAMQLLAGWGWPLVPSLHR